MNDRNWDDPEYKKWRLSVYRRDNFCCQFPDCGRKGLKAKLQAHHIKRWVDFPELRFQLTNGVTLCKLCHKKIEGQEQSYEGLFLNIVNKKNNRSLEKKDDAYFDVKRLLYKRELLVDDDDV